VLADRRFVRTHNIVNKMPRTRYVRPRAIRAECVGSGGRVGQIKTTEIESTRPKVELCWGAAAGVFILVFFHPGLHTT